MIYFSNITALSLFLSLLCYFINRNYIISNFILSYFLCFISVALQVKLTENQFWAQILSFNISFYTHSSDTQYFNYM